MAQELSLKQQYQKLTQARARALRAGQSTQKLDARIQRIQALMGSVVQRQPKPKSSPSKYRLYTEAGKLPVQGGSCSSK